MDHAYATDFLNVLQLEDVLVQNCLKKVKECVENNVQLLQIYRDILSTYEETLSIDKTQFMQSFSTKKVF